MKLEEIRIVTEEPQTHIDEDPRTHIDMMTDLLQQVVDGQWRGRKNTACHCHPEYVSCCPECDVVEDVGEHEATCSLRRLIEEVRAFLRAEAEITGNDFWIP
jgi:hypothetical protein